MKGKISMKDLFGGAEAQFWLVVLMAALIKVMTSAALTWWKGITTVLFAVFSAWVFTEPALHLLSLDPEVYKTSIAAVMALAGEGFMRWIVQTTPDKIIQLWRGKK